MSVFHSGERLVQELLGVEEFANSVGTMIKPTISDRFEAFLNEQNMLMIGSMDKNGQVWSSFIAGDPGIIQVIAPNKIRINTKINEFDPLFSNIEENKEIGVVVINLVSRIRMRINGVISKNSNGSIEVQAEQVYGNCPKFIQARNFSYKPDINKQNKVAYREKNLTQSQQVWINQSDTFFIASSSSEGKMDVSHRGGMPGFIKVFENGSLMFPDYSGNNLFNTLGNIVQNPKVGLLFINFENGDILQLSGEAHVIWEMNDDMLSQFPGAERLVEFQVKEVIQTDTAGYYQWEFIKYSPFNPKAI
ncbi:pyridoxamine 5'-phosphate oxidase family protein [Gottfriedia solisilvae]|uniref:Pyridoxamine 5'-phosphate oxidase N-terminal domain-containing protein n=1 Tax=Gottfriedia solisilvae TaxID=1516104 RepID=A0A8J3ASD8_9BACI|nr:pyridoxamine 5'-phosphate oxidase family protein [Gottfriedia solisilvae]GGI17835.1 hypothetical protein GCM10007380_39920 [Gottfriedia solisilvae]